MSKLASDRPRTGKRRGILFGIAAFAVVGVLVALFWPSPDAETLAKRAGSAFMERRFADADADLARIRKLREPTPLDLMLEAQLALVKGRTEEALIALTKVPDDFAMAAQARLEAGQIQLRRFRYVEAERHFLDAIRLDPKSVQARRELVYIYGMQLRRPELNATFQELARISTLTSSEVFLWSLARGVTWEATEIIATLKKCLDADPSDYWAKLGMAEGYLEVHQLDQAESLLATMPEADAKARSAKVRLALDRGDDQTAESLLAGGSVDDVDLALLRGRFAQARGDGPEAVRQFRIAHAKAPNLREAVLGLGQALKMTGDIAHATPLLDLARKHERLAALVSRAGDEKEREKPALLRDLGEACAALGRFGEARAWYNLAITKDPFDIKAQDGLARTRELEAGAKLGPG